MKSFTRYLSLVAGLAVVLSGPAIFSAESGWITLIDGDRGMDNFNRVGSANWAGYDGFVGATSSAGGAGFLVTKESYNDFELRVEFWVTDDANSEILVKGPVNLGCAVDTDNGLMVPVIRDAGARSPVELAAEVKRLAAACKDRTIKREESLGGTFTISNVGSYGGMFATPVINYREVAILAAGRAKERVMVKDGRFYAGLSLPLSLSCDHRVVDGAEGARFLNTVVGLLENPEQLI